MDSDFTEESDDYQTNEEKKSFFFEQRRSTMETEDFKNSGKLNYPPSLTHQTSNCTKNGERLLNDLFSPLNLNFGNNFFNGQGRS